MIPVSIKGVKTIPMKEGKIKKIKLRLMARDHRGKIFLIAKLNDGKYVSSKSVKNKNTDADVGAYDVKWDDNFFYCPTVRTARLYFHVFEDKRAGSDLPIAQGGNNVGRLLKNHKNEYAVKTKFCCDYQKWEGVLEQNPVIKISVPVDVDQGFTNYRLVSLQKQDGVAHHFYCYYEICDENFSKNNKSNTVLDLNIGVFDIDKKTVFFTDGYLPDNKALLRSGYSPSLPDDYYSKYCNFKIIRVNPKQAGISKAYVIPYIRSTEEFKGPISVKIQFALGDKEKKERKNEIDVRHPVGTYIKNKQPSVSESTEIRRFEELDVNVNYRGDFAAKGALYIENKKNVFHFSQVKFNGVYNRYSYTLDQYIGTLPHEFFKDKKGWTEVVLDQSKQ